MSIQVATSSFLMHGGFRLLVVAPSFLIFIMWWWSSVHGLQRWSVMLRLWGLVQHSGWWFGQLYLNLHGQIYCFYNRLCSVQGTLVLYSNKQPSHVPRDLLSLFFCQIIASIEPIKFYRVFVHFSCSLFPILVLLIKYLLKLKRKKSCPQ